MLSRHCFHAVWFSSFRRYGPNKLLYKPLRLRYFVIVAESRPKQEVPDWRGVMMCPWDYSQSSWHWVLSCLVPCFPDGSQQVVWCFSEDHDEDTDSFKRKKKHDFPSASLFVKETNSLHRCKIKTFSERMVHGPRCSGISLSWWGNWGSCGHRLSFCFVVPHNVPQFWPLMKQPWLPKPPLIL